MDGSIMDTHARFLLLIISVPSLSLCFSFFKRKLIVASAGVWWRFTAARIRFLQAFLEADFMSNVVMKFKLKKGYPARVENKDARVGFGATVVFGWCPISFNSGLDLPIGLVTRGFSSNEDKNGETRFRLMFWRQVRVCTAEFTRQSVIYASKKTEVTIW
jgi:hypothetical protein